MYGSYSKSNLKMRITTAKEGTLWIRTFDRDYVYHTAIEYYLSSVFYDSLRALIINEEKLPKGMKKATDKFNLSFTVFRNKLRFAVKKEKWLLDRDGIDYKLIGF